MNFNVKKVFAKDVSYYRSMRTIFHEEGHNIDNLMHLEKTFNGGKRPPNSMYSYHYKNNVFGKAIVKDVNNTLNKYKTQCELLVEEARKKAIVKVKENNFRDFLKQFGFSKEEIEKQIEEAVEIDTRKYANGIIVPQNRKELEMSFSNYMKKHYSEEECAAISDTFESVFEYIEFPFYTGHGFNYWKQAKYLRNTEAFANLYSYAVEGDKSYDMFKRFLPNTTAIFNEMIAGG